MFANVELTKRRQTRISKTRFLYFWATVQIGDRTERSVTAQGRLVTAQSRSVTARAKIGDRTGKISKRTE